MAGATLEALRKEASIDRAAHPLHQYRGYLAQADGEPDLIWIINRGPTDTWCGCVCIPVTHSAYKMLEWVDSIERVDGLTIESELGRVTNEEITYCCNTTVPGRTGESVATLMFGFDCCHAYDYSPILHATSARDASTLWYHTYEMVHGRVLGMAAKIAKSGLSPM